MQATATLGIGLALLLALCDHCTGLVTETSASNKPSFSFACTIAAGGGSSSFCSGDDKPFAQVEKVEVFRDYTNKVGECLDPERDYVIALLSDWFNNECKLPPTDRKEDNIKIPTQYLQESMMKYCNISQPTIVKVEVNYDCVRDPDEILKIVTVKPRPGGSTIPTRPTGRIPIPGSTITTTTRAAPPIRPPSTRRADPDTNGGEPGVTTAQTPQESDKGGSLTTTELVLAILIPVIFLLIVMAVLLWYCLCYSGRSDGRKESVPSAYGASALGASRSSTMFLVPGAYKSSGDELSGMVYGGSSLVDDYAQYPGNVSRRSIDKRDGGGGDDYSPVYNNLQRPSQSSKGGVDGDDYGAPPSTIYGSAIGNGEPSSGGGGFYSADAPASRRSSADPAESGGGFYDRRLSDRRLMMQQRHPSETSLRSGSLSTSVVDNRKLSRTSYAELPGDRRSSSGSNFASPPPPPPPPAGERKISLSLGSAEERRISDGLQQQPTSGGRRPTTYGGPGMPEIHESHESVAGDSVFYSGASRSLGFLQDAAAAADAARYDGAPTPHHLGPPGRMSWAGETEIDTNYSYWPPEWQRWLKSRPSAV